MLRGALGTIGLLVSLTISRDMGPHLAAPETPASTAATDAAPDFVLATAWGWHSFREIHEDTPVVLVFEADDAALAALEKARPALEAGGVEIAAVTRDSDGANWDRIERLGVRYALWSDPHGRLAELYGLTGTGIAWCRIDARGHVAELRPAASPQELVQDIERSLPAPATANGDEVR